MTQANETNSRIARLEALTLEIAAANLRHDRDIDQNKTAIARHDEEFSRINATLATITQAQQRTEEQQEVNAQQIAANAEQINSLSQRFEDIAQQQEATAAQQDINQQQLATLTAGLLELRTLVANYIQSRSQLEEMNQ